MNKKELVTILEFMLQKDVDVISENVPGYTAYRKNKEENREAYYNYITTTAAYNRTMDIITIIQDRFKE